MAQVTARLPIPSTPVVGVDREAAVAAAAVIVSAVATAEAKITDAVFVPAGIKPTDGNNTSRVAHFR